MKTTDREAEVFLRATEITDTESRNAYIQQACKGDKAMQDRVHELLNAHDASQGPFDAPLAQQVENSTATVEMETCRIQIGMNVGPYKLLQKIGAGGMGMVFMAEQTEPFERRVAVKIIKPGMDSSQVIARFEAERQALALMDHPNIAKVLDAGTTSSGEPYFVMELVKGVPLTRYCDEQHLSPQERLELFLPICKAIQHAHQKGVIHRDLKPSNVIVALYDGRPVPKVIDFGVAKALTQRLTEKTVFTQFGQVVGTLEYMSPEQAEVNQLDVDTRSDIYSLGVMLYELLTGSTPLQSERLRSLAFEEMMRAIREEEPPRPSLRLSTIETLPSVAAARRIEPSRLRNFLHGELDWVVMKALEKDRARRYETANGLGADIERFLNDLPVQACPPSLGYKLKKFTRRNKGLLATAAVIFASLVLGLIGTSWQAYRANQQSVIAFDAKAEATKERDLALAAKQKVQQEALRADREAARAKQQLRKSQVLHMAAQATSISQELPVTSVLLANEAVKASTGMDSVTRSLAHQTLLVTTGELGGIPLVGHSSRIHDCEIAPDGQWAVTASKDGTARIWDLSTAKRQVAPEVIDLSEKYLNDVAISPNGQWVFASHTFCDMSLRNPTHSLQWFHGYGRGTFSPDGQLAAIANPNHIQLVQLDEERKWHATFILPESEKTNLPMCFSGDKNWLLVCGSPDAPRIWRLSDPTLAPIDLAEHAHTASTACFSEDGRWLVTGGRRYKTDLPERRSIPSAILYDLSDPNFYRKPIELMDSSTGVLQVCTSRDSHWLAAACQDGTVRLWDLTLAYPSKFVTILPVGTLARRVAFSADGQWLAASGSDRKIQVWKTHDVYSSRSSFSLKGHEGPINKLAFSPNKRYLLSVSADSYPRLWRFDQSGPQAWPRRLCGHTASLTSISIGPRSRVAMTSSGDGTLRLWDLDSDSPAESSKVLQAHDDWINAAILTPNGKRIVSGGVDETINIWNLDNEGAQQTKVASLQLEDTVHVLEVSPDDHWLAAGLADGKVQLFDLTQPPEKLRSLELYQHEGNIHSLLFSPDGHWLVSAGKKDEQVALWNLDAENISESRRELDLSGSLFKQLDLAFSPDSRWLATATEFCDMWDLNEQQLTKRHVGRHRNSIDEVAFTKDGRFVVTAGWNQYMRVWDVQCEPPSLVREFSEHTDAVVAMRFSHDKNWLATASLDGTVRLWDFSRGIPNASSMVLESAAPIAFSPDDRWLITCRDQNSAQLWDLNIDSLGDFARQITRRELTNEERQRFLPQTNLIDE